ncbi:siderophore biosynthesis protein [Pseudohyphozyma bogoriensis]|nr:siderophore biosynthesis protein [Pseudohyphozyma bogoriensis]
MTSSTRLDQLRDSLPPLPTAPRDARRASSTRTVRFHPALPSSVPATSEDLAVTASARHLTTTAVTFSPSGVIHTQYTIDEAAGTATVVLRLSNVDPAAAEDGLAPGATRALWNALWPYVALGGKETSPEELNIELPLPSVVLHDALLALGARHLHPAYALSRAALFENFYYATRDTIDIPFPHVSSETGGVAHPLRAKKPVPGTTLYSRNVPHLDAYFQLQVMGTGERDLQTIHEWMNEPRVDKFWSEAGSLEAHQRFLNDCDADPHTISVVGSYIPVSNDSEPQRGEERATYSQIYYLKEDKLAQLMDGIGEAVDDYDRGVHVLVGSNSHRGPHRVRAWLPSLVHYCFLSDPRTRRVVAEPNQLNEKMIKYFESAGFVRRGTVVFPHKTSALMICDRREFYGKRFPF